MDYIDLIQQGYFYKQLQEKKLDKALQVYEILYISVLCHQSEIVVEWDEADEELMPQFLFLLLADHPYLFYVRAERAFFCYGESYTKICLRYGMSEQESRVICEKINWQVKKIALLAQSHGGIDLLEQIRYLYKYFVTHVIYAREQLKSKDERELCRIHSAVGALLDGSAVCDGIARAFKMVLDELGIENRVIRRNLQKSAEFSHEWNVIKLYGDELHADITWEMDVYTLHNRMRFEFFLLTENEMEVKHRKGKEQECFKKRKK